MNDFWRRTESICGGAGSGSIFLTPFARDFIQLAENTLNFLDALGEAIGNGGRNGSLIFAIDEAALLESAKPLGENARGDSLHLAAKGTEASRAFLT